MYWPLSEVQPNDVCLLIQVGEVGMNKYAYMCMYWSIMLAFCSSFVSFGVDGEAV